METRTECDIGPAKRDLKHVVIDSTTHMICTLFTTLVLLDLVARGVILD